MMDIGFVYASLCVYLVCFAVVLEALSYFLERNGESDWLWSTSWFFVRLTVWWFQLRSVIYKCLDVALECLAYTVPECTCSVTHIAVAHTKNYSTMLPSGKTHTHKKVRYFLISHSSKAKYEEQSETWKDHYTRNGIKSHFQCLVQVITSSKQPVLALANEQIWPQRGLRKLSKSEDGASVYANVFIQMACLLSYYCKKILYNTQ